MVMPRKMSSETRRGVEGGLEEAEVATDCSEAAGAVMVLEAMGASARGDSNAREEAKARGAGV